MKIVDHMKPEALEAITSPTMRPSALDAATTQTPEEGTGQVDSTTSENTRVSTPNEIIP